MKRCSRTAGFLPPLSLTMVCLPPFCLGRMHLKGKDAVEVLIRGLQDKRSPVRHFAANGLIVLGPDAKSATPALIRFLETGAEARGVYYYRHAIAFQIEANLALKALAAIGADAEPALPVILSRATALVGYRTSF